MSRRLRSPEVTGVHILAHQLEIVEELPLVLSQMGDHVQQMLEQRDCRTTPRWGDAPDQQVPLTGRLDATYRQTPIFRQQFQRLLDARNAGERRCRRYVVIGRQSINSPILAQSPVSLDEDLDGPTTTEAGAMH
jgi:hypothetical protein